MLKTVTAHDIAKMMGYKNPRQITDRISKRPDFPKPFSVGKTAPKVWLEEEVLAWFMSLREK
jgi:predicted DNA-binding transcriptional regulator AlpA